MFIIYKRLCPPSPRYIRNIHFFLRCTVRRSLLGIGARSGSSERLAQLLHLFLDDFVDCIASSSISCHPDWLYRTAAHWSCQLIRGTRPLVLSTLVHYTIYLHLCLISLFFLVLVRVFVLVMNHKILSSKLILVKLITHVVFYFI